ncbi:ECF RNA polymerase sigma factor RpoE [mine drainage metagenome]|uniref:ECF RNA polymerase sigma factor RpoE n=1 Tax=mine drainage metagenome TaxID=410659 RepID=A0A1J5R5A2_9ZZZZ
MSTENDNAAWGALMAAAQSGDQASYARLLRDITPLLRRVGRRKWPMAADADLEDIVQDVLLSLHSVRQTYDPARPFLPWLLTILHHRLVDGIRRRTRQNAHETAVDRFEETFSEIAANIPEEPIGGHDALHKAIASLPGGQRRAVELLKLKELSLKEAALQTGMSVSALKVATHRALKALRVALTGKV